MHATFGDTWTLYRPPLALTHSAAHNDVITAGRCNCSIGRAFNNHVSRPICSDCSLRPSGTSHHLHTVRSAYSNYVVVAIVGAWYRSDPCFQCANGCNLQHGSCMPGRLPSIRKSHSFGRDKSAGRHSCSSPIDIFLSSTSPPASLEVMHYRIK